jgi:BirA family biotin operon repressor/biotin-[acetyl-CoA-carboxylase] ligase
MVVPAAGNLVHPALLVSLADGAVQSGETLARRLGVSRAAVWKGIERLRGQGIAVEALPRRGYRLAAPVELLDAARIRAELGPSGNAGLPSLEVLYEVDSTNSRVLDRGPAPAGRGDVAIAELQHAGRGRRGRRWIAPFGSGLALSLGWTFAEPPRDLPSLSLAVGVAICRALARSGAVGVGLKWPNDLWWRDRKLGGVLIELRAEAGGPAYVVIGVGLNIDLGVPARAEIEAAGVRVAAVSDACGKPPSRNAVAGAILGELLSMLREFEAAGFAPFRGPWAALDVLRDRAVTVLLGEKRIAGLARGVDADGAFLLDADGGRQKFVSGEVSLRLEGVNN